MVPKCLLALALRRQCQGQVKADMQTLWLRLQNTRRTQLRSLDWDRVGQSSNSQCFNIVYKIKNIYICLSYNLFLFFIYTYLSIFMYIYIYKYFKSKIYLYFIHYILCKYLDIWLSRFGRHPAPPPPPQCNVPCITSLQLASVHVW